jgi:cytochrome c oxidase subunit 2
MRSTTATWLRRLALLAGGLVLASCGETKQDVFHPKGENASKINDLQVPVFIAAGVVGVLVAAGLIYVIMSGRRAAGRDEEPRQLHGHFLAEISWTILPTLILLAVAIPTVITVLDLADKPKDAITISVYGQQWWWSYEYDLNADGKPDIITANELVVPVDQSVELLVQSRDVIHSFWIPALFGTRDAVPGRVQKIEMKATEIGEFDGQCKEYCGLSHANMRARAVVLSKDDYQRWLTDQQKPAATPPAGTAAATGATTFTTKCASCHQINGVNDVEGKAALIAGHAPNLTHLMSRKVFAGAEFPLWVPNKDGKLELNRNQLEAWLRNPPALVPMAPEEARGMPNLNLGEDEIDNLIAYLETLGPNPPNSVDPSEAK